jgi:hypothetical protein
VSPVLDRARSLLGKSEGSIFATRTLTGHLMRGAVAFGLLYTAISEQHTHPGWSLMAGVLALVALRGCPACWTIGLAETVAQRLRRSPRL